MNKRIAELTDKSGLYSHLYTEEAFKCREKFAKLVVKECINVLNKEVDIALRKDGEQEHIDVVLLEHFGVDE